MPSGSTDLPWHWHVDAVEISILMRVLLLGATGLIGSAVAARLHRDGIEIVGIARSAGAFAKRLPVDRWISLDLREATSFEVWLPHLAGVDAVVNCAGVLQDNVRDSTSGIHVDAPTALWRACEQAGVRRVIHVSAVGVDRGGLTAFSESKRIGDEALMGTNLDWVILRPSVVLARAAHGGSALIRALASFPILPRTPDAGPLDVVQMDDVAETVAVLLREGAASRVALELVGPERLGFEDVIASYRAWLGRKPARLVRVPAFLMSLLYKLGDAVSWLGWRPAIRTTGQREIVRGAVGDPSAWTRTTGIRPKSLRDALAEEPSGVQERWFANLYLLKPLLFGTFVLFWILTGIISLGPGYDLAAGTMAAAGAGPLTVPSVIAGGVADIVIGIAIAFRRTSRLGLIAALLVSIFYIVAGTLLVPELWRDPLGPMMKIWPIIALNLVLLAILDER